MSRPPSSNGKRFGSKNGNISFLTVSICNPRKKVKRYFVMSVEITDNSKEVSGAIHQVGQAMADTGAFCKPGSLCNKVIGIERWSFAIPGSLCGHCGLSANGKVWCSQSRIQRSQRIHTAAQAAQGKRSQAVTGDTAKMRIEAAGCSRANGNQCRYSVRL